MAEAGPTYTKTGHNGCQIGFPGRWEETQFARQIRSTYVTAGI